MTAEESPRKPSLRSARILSGAGSSDNLAEAEDGTGEKPPDTKKHSISHLLTDGEDDACDPLIDYPDEFFESNEDAVPILRHPYYNELTEDLGITAETLLEGEAMEQSEQDGVEFAPNEPKRECLQGALIEDELFSRSVDSEIIIDRAHSSIPLVSVDISQSNGEIVKDRAQEVTDDTAAVDDTYYINYVLLKRFLENTASVNQVLPENDPGDRFAFYSARTGFVRAATLQDISPSLIQIMQSGVFWLDICTPSPLELKVFGEVFKLHPLTLEDIQLDDVREKCDVFKDSFIVCLKAFENAAKMDYSSPVNLYILCAGKEGVVSIHHQPLHFSQTIAKRIRLLSARTGLSTDWITYGIMDDVIDSFSPAIYELECEVELIDDLCMQPGVAKSSGKNEDSQYVEGAMFQRITASRKNLTALTRLVSSKNEAVRNVIKRCGNRLSNDALVYLRDLQDHVRMMEQCLEHQDDGLNRAYSNYLAHLSIETSHTSNRMSRVMKTLSAFAAVTTPCTVVSCLLGMNLRGPFWPYGEDRAGPGSGSGGPYDFILVVSFILTATVLLVYVGKRNDWF